MRLSQLLSALPAVLDRTGDGDPDVLSIEHDSRRVTPGALFVARRGGSVDGHTFIPEAIANGAVAVVGEDPGQLVERIGNSLYVRVPDSAEALAWLCAAFHDFPARKLVMIGVTGTDGKTTTCSLIHSILTTAGLKAGLITTVSAVIGDQLFDTGLHTTTPDSPDVQGYLAQMVEAGMTHCVLEATSHGLAQHRVTACDFDIAVVTNITHEHLDFHRSLDAYRAAKARLFEGLATAHKKPGVEKLAVLNADDEGSFDYLRKRIAVPHLAYGLAANADVRAADIEYHPDCTRFSVIANLQSPIFNLQTSLVGDYNISNCLAAITVGVRGLGLEGESAARGVASLKGVPGRMERFDLGQPFTAIVDFAHTPNALKRALETARRMAKGRVIVVFGSAGLRDVAKRRWMGEVAAKLADFTIITAEDPRTESLEAIMAESAEGAKSKGGVEGKTFWRVADRGEAIQFAVDMAQSGDVVIACGKAHEQSMCFGMIEYPWDDRVALKAALSKRLGFPGPAMPELPTSHGWTGSADKPGFSEKPGL
jgi:UDP-N-acetylmuramoyl-L-alanyl-D-glutamate--2,6-diaminopimelate ligase